MVGLALLIVIELLTKTFSIINGFIGIKKKKVILQKLFATCYKNAFILLKLPKIKFNI